MSKYLNITGCFLFLSFFFQTILFAQNTSIGTKDIVSGEVWKDTDGNVINAMAAVSSSTMENTTGLESTGLLPVLRRRWE